LRVPFGSAEPPASAATHAHANPRSISIAPIRKGQKNDFRDAEAIAEAVQRPTMKFVATQTADQLDPGSLRAPPDQQKKIAKLLRTNDAEFRLSWHISKNIIGTGGAQREDDPC
jgi:transposase